MSDNGSGLNGRGSTVEIPFELQLALREIEYTDDVAAAFITAVWQMSNFDPDESPPRVAAGCSNSTVGTEPPYKWKCKIVPAVPTRTPALSPKIVFSFVVTS